METPQIKRQPTKNVCAVVGFGVSYKFLSSFNVWSRGTNTFSKAHHCANTNVVCKAFDDMREKDIKIKLETGDIVSTHLSLDGPVNDISRIILTLADGRKFIGTGDDWFNALRHLRIQTDRLGIKLLVQASRPNCWPSGMSGQMGNGTKIFERDLAKPSSTWRVVNSFDEALETDIGSLKDQDEFNKKIWGTTN